MSEVNRWRLGLLLLVLIFEIGYLLGFLGMFLYGVVASIGFVLFTHEKTK